MSSPDLRSRLIGAIVGTAVGDALGVPVEFTGRSMRDADPVADMRGFGTWNQPPGTWSDDSSMMLSCAETLLSGWDPAAMMAGFSAWLEDSRWTPHGSVFDIGNTTRNALILFRIGKPWQECGGDDEMSNGNGALMRILPVSCWLFGRSTTEVLRLAGEASALTHAHVRSRLCCAIHAMCCDALLSGSDVRSGLRAAALRLRGLVPAQERAPLAALLDSTILDQDRVQVRSDGYVVSTLEASLWCLAHHDSFADATLAAVNLGGDADTTGAVAGGLAGLRAGSEGIPRAWIDALARRDDIIALAERFADACLGEWARHGSG